MKNKEINKKTFERVILFIDHLLFPRNSEYNYYRLEGLYNISYHNSEEMKATLAQFYPGNHIKIFRSNYTVPEISFLNEIILLLHEYGHYVSLHNGNSIELSEVGYSYNKSDYSQRSLVIEEEFKAWEHGLKIINQLPCSFEEKEIIKFSALELSFSLLHKYVFGLKENYNENL
jgi:hypothetical protein